MNEDIKLTIEENGRRIFNVDVGDVSPEQIKEYLKELTEVIDMKVAEVDNKKEK